MDALHDLLGHAADEIVKVNRDNLIRRILDDMYRSDSEMAAKSSLFWIYEKMISLADSGDIEGAEAFYNDETTQYILGRAREAANEGQR